jgi:hypothetical protein
VAVDSFVQTIRGSFVQQIEPAKDAMRMEQVVKLFSMAFAQVCALKEVQRLGIDSFVRTRPATFVETIGPAREALSVEGSIQNLNGEFVNHFRKFSEWLKRKPGESEESFTHSRFRRGIKARPADLYKCNVRKLTWQQLKNCNLDGQVIQFYDGG